MRIDIDVIESINEKEERLMELKDTLKAEYVGIDKVIDEVISAITPYYIFPDSLKKPIIVNLWGLTGTGKTSLVERIIDFLNLRKQYIKYDMGEYSGNNASLRYEISRQLKDLDKLNPVFVFDEFQLGRTIDSDHKEQNSSSSRVLWELLDSGIIYINDNDNSSDFLEMMHGIKKSTEADIKLDTDGYVVGGVNEYYKQRDINCHYPRNYRVATVTEDGKTEDLDRNHNERIWNLNEDGKIYRFEEPLFINEQDFDTMYRILPDFFDNNPSFEINHAKFFKNKTIKQIYSLIFEQIFTNTSFLTPRDYSKSLIFCLGNLDECYNMSHDLDPNADADSFYKNSLKITISDVKKALSHRFRMEQIARLGNSHIIYPSLNRNAYERYINMMCDKISVEFNDNYEANLIFDDTVKKMIYHEGVVPSQGIRPVISSFNTLIQSYIPIMMYKLIKDDNYSDISEINWKYNKYNYNIEYNSNTISIPVDAKLEKLCEVDESDELALVAVHEAGHAIVGALLMDMSPVIYTKTLDTDSKGKCIFEDFNDNIQTYNMLLDKICLYYGGIIAERIIFGDGDISLGASNDLKMITHLAANIHKEYGFVRPYKANKLTETDMNGFYYVVDTDIEKNIKDLCHTLYDKTFLILSRNKNVLVELSKYLVSKTKMEKVEFEEFMKSHIPDITFRNKYNNYRSKLMLG